MPSRLLANLTFANQLTFLRLVAVPFFVIAILQGRFGLACALFAGAAATDVLDGLIARAFHQRTPLGGYLDPAADKLLLVSGIILLTEYPHMFREIPMANRIPVWLCILTVFRDVGIVSISLMLYLAYGISRFPPTLLGKLTTLAESLLLGFFLLANQLERPYPQLHVGVWAVLLLIVGSGLDYLWRTVRTVREHGAGGAG